MTDLVAARKGATATQKKAAKYAQAAVRGAREAAHEAAELARTPVRGATAAMAESTGSARCSGPGCVAWSNAGSSGKVGDTPTSARCRAAADGCAVAGNSTAMFSRYTQRGRAPVARERSEQLPGRLPRRGLQGMGEGCAGGGARAGGPPSPQRRARVRTLCGHGGLPGGDHRGDVPGDRRRRPGSWGYRAPGVRVGVGGDRLRRGPLRREADGVLRRGGRAGRAAQP